MARTVPVEKAGLVVGLCPDTSVYERLASAARAKGLTDSTVRAAGTGSTLRNVGERFSMCRDRELPTWARGLRRIDHLDEQTVFDDVGDDPLLEACFNCLARIPGGGASQGSWRGNALNDVFSALGKGGIILVVEAHSLDEQTNWARTLLKSGCAFVQTHDGSTSAV